MLMDAPSKTELQKEHLSAKRTHWDDLMAHLKVVMSVLLKGYRWE